MWFWIIGAGVGLLFVGGIYYWMNRSPSTATGLTTMGDTIALATCKAAAKTAIWLAIQNAVLADDTAMATELIGYYTRINAWKMPEPLPTEPVVAADSNTTTIASLTAQIEAIKAQLAAKTGV